MISKSTSAAKNGFFTQLEAYSQNTGKGLNLILRHLFLCVDMSPDCISNSLF